MEAPIIAEVHIVEGVVMAEVVALGTREVAHHLAAAEVVVDHHQEAMEVDKNK